MIAHSLAALLAGAHAQDSLTAFVAAARAATVRYQDPAAAAADGYRPVGPDFPGMGVHWVNPKLLAGGVVAVDRPPILEYAPLVGRPSLVGVAYATLVTDTLVVPHALPAPPSAWHAHSGTLEEESFVLSHAGLGHAAHGARLAVLHAWIWLENPGGLFTTDNWALPYARLGLRAPVGAPEVAARAVALAAGGESYLAALVRAVARPDSATAARVRELLVRGRETLLAGLASDRGAEVTDSEVEWLAAEWRRLVAAIQETVGPTGREALGRLPS